MLPQTNVQSQLAAPATAFATAAVSLIGYGGEPILLRSGNERRGAAPAAPQLSVRALGGL